jgi:opacity protein-like surface antigen
LLRRVNLTGRSALDTAALTSATLGQRFLSSNHEQQQGAQQYLDHIALRGGLYAGWNFQVAPAYVVGVEGDIAYANEAAIFHGSHYPANLQFGTPSLPFGASPSDSLKLATRWDGSLRLRGGWLPTPSVLLYLTAGLAWANVEATSICSPFRTPNVLNCAPGNYFSGTLGPSAITHSATNLGWTAGIGMDMLLGSHWVARVQYRFADFGYPSGSAGRFSFTDVRTCSGCPSAANSPLTVAYEFLVMQHIFEVRLQVRAVGRT